MNEEGWKHLNFNSQADLKEL